MIYQSRNGRKIGGHVFVMDTLANGSWPSIQPPSRCIHLLLFQRTQFIARVEHTRRCVHSNIGCSAALPRLGLMDSVCNDFPRREKRLLLSRFPCRRSEKVSEHQCFWPLAEPSLQITGCSTSTISCIVCAPLILQCMRSATDQPSFMHGCVEGRRA